MNDHYTRDYNPPTGTRVSSSDLINEFQAVQGGFDSVQAELGNTLHQASGAPMAALPNAVSRALKVLSFDADGNPRSAIGEADFAQATASAETSIAQAAVATAQASAATAQAGIATAKAAEAAASAASIAGGPVASVNGRTGVVTGLVEKVLTQLVLTNTTAVAGVCYLLGANGVVLTAPTGQVKGDYFGFRLLSGITGAVVDFGATKLRGATPGAMALDIDPGPVDLSFEDSTRGYV